MDYHERAHQATNEDISIGTATCIFLAEYEDEVKGTAMERIFNHVRAFYETVVEKMIAKFPYNDQTLADLALLDPRKRSTIASTVRLCKLFMSADPSRIDEVVQQFLAFCVTPDHQFPPSSKEAAIDHFWDAMSNVNAVTETCKSIYFLFSHTQM